MILLIFSGSDFFKPKTINVETIKTIKTIKPSINKGMNSFFCTNCDVNRIESRISICIKYMPNEQFPIITKVSLKKAGILLE